jgi:WD40 repeat protein
MGSVQSVMCVAFSPNDEFVLGGSNDNSVRLWAVQYGRVRVTLPWQPECLFLAYIDWTYCESCECCFFIRFAKSGIIPGFFLKSNV